VLITPSNIIEIGQTLAQACAKRAGQADRKAQLPAEDLRALRESGYLALSVPLEHGGAGLSLRECAAAQHNLAQGSASTAMVAAMQLQIFGHAREVHEWPEAAFERLCRAAAREGALFNSATGEPDLDSPSRGGRFRTTAQPAPGGGHFIVNGRKTWVTGGPHLTHLLTSVTIGGQKGILWMYNNQPGMTWIRTWENALSLRASESHDLVLENAIVSAENLLTRGESTPQPNLWFPAMITAVYLGTARAARDAAIQFALERVPPAPGKSIATQPHIQRTIGEMDIRLQAAEALFFDATAAWDGKENHRTGIAIRLAAAKHFAIESAAQITEQALRLAGEQGLKDDRPFERYFRDVRAGFMQPPAPEDALAQVGNAAIAQKSGL